MHKSYLVATQRPWGQAVYEKIIKRDAAWALLSCDGPTEGTGAFGVLKVAVSLQPRYIFFLNWSEPIPADLFTAYECVNFHCTALPYGRGGHPIENLILAGHTWTTMTSHRVSADLDAGPIYTQAGAIDLSGTKEEICTRFVDPVVSAIGYIVDKEPRPRPQSGQVVRFSRLSREAYVEFWRKRAGGAA